MRKRVQAWIMAFIMLFTTIALPLMDTVNVYAAEENADELKIVFHYLREDGDYDDWDVYGWGGIPETSTFQKVDETGAIAEAVVTPGSKEIGFIVRKTDWSDREWSDEGKTTGDRKIDVSKYASGTVHVYVKSGVITTEIDDTDTVAYIPPAKTKSIFFHYKVNEIGTDGDARDYSDWGVHAWAEEGGSTLAAGHDFLKDEEGNLVVDENGFVAEVKATPDAVKVGYIVRKADWSDREKVDGEEKNRYVDVSEFTSGEIHVYVKQDVAEPVIDYSRAQKAPITMNFYIDKKKTDANWGLWLWDDVGTSAIYPLFEENEDGKLMISYEVAPTATWVGFIVRDDNWQKDPDGDRKVDVSTIVGGVVDVYLTSGSANFDVDNEKAITGTKIKKAVYEEEKFVVTTTLPVENYADEFRVFCENEEVEIASVEALATENTYQISLVEEIDLTKAYKVLFGGNMYKVSMPSLYKEEKWVAANTYTGDDLGVTLTENATSFRVWAPLASQVSVNLYEAGNGGSAYETVAMEKDVNGTWVATVDSNLNGKYYTYTVNNAGEKSETCDPYAKSTGVNGDRAMILDMSTTNPEGWENDKNPNANIGPNNFTDAVIYELHVRDASIDESSGVSEANKGNFLGLTEHGDNTILDHMVDLGVTHLHLLPVYDFSSVDETKDGFNWGYDPKNYNVPEGSYSSDPYNGEVRVKEMKEMVQTLHENDISVVMDVVYNHVSDAGNFCFNKIVPNYFSRMDENGGYHSNSGCGNDTASEHVMVRKYIVDSVKYWADEYHIDGFRFDLVGLIDTVTINEIMKAVWETNPDVVFYGEGWNMNDYDTGVSMTVQSNADEVPGFAFFNDTFRDTVKGSVFDNTAPGWASGLAGQETTIAKSFMGASVWGHESTECPTPLQTVNYTSCHDNNTLYDRLKLTMPEASEDVIEDMNKLIAAYTFTSQGVPFMHAAEEFLRSKPLADGSGYDHNSYSSGDAINSIKWNELADHKDIYEYYKGLIAFRKAHASLRMTDATDVANTIEAIDGLDKNVVAFDIKKTDNDNRMFVVFNPNEEATTVTLPEAAEGNQWSVYVDGNKAGTKVLDVVSGEVTVEAISAMVIVEEKTVEADGFDVVEKNVEIAAGDEYELTSVLTPGDATVKVEWTSSNEEVATVDKYGIVKAIKAGVVTITAKVGEFIEECVVTVVSVILDKDTADLKIGENITLVATVGPEGNTASVEWTSSNEAVATVDNTGKVTAVAAGTATITAKAGIATATCKVTVTPVEVAGITLDKDADVLEVGATVTLKATVDPANATDPTVTWTSSDDKVATVKDGVVTAVANGTATITAKAGNKTATCTITVKTSVASITLNETAKELTVGGTLTLTATVGPETATDKTVTWATSDEKVAAVKDGVVTAVAAGTATITAKAGDKTATCTITVKAAEADKPAEPDKPAVVDVTSITLDKATAALKKAETVTLVATVGPENATDKTVTWTSSDEKVATVDATGKVTAVANGTATITAKAGDKTATCIVTVTTDVADVKLNKSKANVAAGKTLTLTATIAPSDASDQTVTWTSSDAKIATVKDGKVTGKKAGTVTITATTANGKKATCKVTVVEAKFNASTIAVQVKKTTSALKVTSTLKGDKVKSWKSSDKKIATVTSKGVIKGVKAGKATITVTMESGATAKCTVTVQKGKVVTKKLTIDKSKVTLQKGKTVTLTVTRNPISATEKITWTTSNKKVATVDKNGKVKGVKAGTVTITAKTSNGKKVTCKVTVKNPTVKLAKTKATIKVGKTTTIKIKSTFPENDTVKSYKTSNKKVATVDKNGKVKGVKAGTATITVTMKSGAKATFKVTVKKK